MSEIVIERITDLPHRYLEDNDFTFYVEHYAHPSFDTPFEQWPILPVVPFRKNYPLAPFVNDEGDTFLARYQGVAVGHITLSKNWNDYTLIEEVAVSRYARRRGIGTALLHAAQQWAHEHDTAGLMLETQNNNLTACRCYQRYGFTLGGIDRLLYRGQADIADHEIALFWYLPFNNEVGY
ncbi:GNAT family N-acetyltransferase [Serratia sp. NPDC078593]|uniref:GNAT family N-acetyltransferase n=1 Tax=unclassified Serratia (in: enterobacteria) TaxID=2647522 RepID=UPI0037CFA13F